MTDPDNKYAADDYTPEDRLRQLEEIEAEQRQRPLVGDREEGFASLEEELKGTRAFTRKLPHLTSKYSSLRRIRGDGNCFYRGFMFRLIEVLLFQKGRGKVDEFERIKKKFDAMGYLQEVGYRKDGIEMFCDFATDYFANDFPRSLSQHEQFFLDPQESMYMVWFCRLLCGGFIKHHWQERFSFFVEGGYLDADDYCAREVEPSDRECEELQITALCDYLEVSVNIEYLGGNEGSDETTVHKFGPHDKEAEIHLLYRPGHYDVIYRGL